MWASLRLGNGQNLMYADFLLRNSKRTRSVISAKKIVGSSAVRAPKK